MNKHLIYVSGGTVGCFFTSQGVELLLILELDMQLNFKVM